MIQIQGFTPKQRKIADLLWSCQTFEQVEQFCKVDPDVRVVRDMIVAAQLDDLAETNLAQEVLDKFRV
jgi:hypothetical protein